MGRWATWQFGPVNGPVNLWRELQLGQSIGRDWDIANGITDGAEMCSILRGVSGVYIPHEDPVSETL